MAMRDLRSAFLNLKRLREIVFILYRHGFGSVLLRLGLDRWLGLGERFRATGATMPNAAPQFASALEEMGATYVKFGQMLATRADLLSPEYFSALTRLQTRVTPLPFAAMREMLILELGGAPENFFRKFDEQAIAAGSIGQVYAAELADGARVAVKIKRPDADRKIREDLSLLNFLAGILESNLTEIAALSPRALVDEFSRGILSELDFVNEAAATEKFHRRFQNAELLTAPKIYWELTSRNVIVEERLDGLPLTAGNAEILSTAEREKLAQALTADFLEQYFSDGFFHSDPHPGNLLLLPNGKIGLIDFGQVGYLSGEMRRNFLGLLAAASGGDLETMADLCAAIGERGATGDSEASAFRRDLAAYAQRFFGAPLKQLNLGAWLDETLIIARRHGFTMPRELTLLAKSAAIMHGVIFSLAPNLRLREILPTFLRRAITANFSPQNLSIGFAAFVYRLLHALKRFPDDARDLMVKISGGKLRIIFHHEGLESIGDQVERASNRITLGLLIAAILLGSSLVLTTAPEFINKISLPFFGGVPLSALIAGGGYLSALTLGFWLAWAILSGKRL